MIQCKKRRIFVAMDIPDELKNAAEAHLKDFHKNNLARVTARENMHITVVFCGDLTDEELNKLKEGAEKIAGETKKFELRPKRIVFAPPHKKAKRMVWLTFKNSPDFTNLSEKFAPFDEKSAKETFPHMTLVRFKEPHYPQLKKLLPEDGIYLEGKTGAFEVKSIHIIESGLSPNGPKYELLESYGIM